MSIQTRSDKLSEKLNELISMLKIASSDVMFCTYSNLKNLNYIMSKLKKLSTEVSFYEIYYKENEDLAVKISRITKTIGFKLDKFGGDIRYLLTTRYMYEE
jgi:hypothetical protein